MNSNSLEAPVPGLDPSRLPAHIAIIMDGNGRWAKQRLLNRVKGHEKGADTVRKIVRATRELGVHVLTLYAFSTENWQRPKTEVSALMTLLKRFLATEKQEMLENGIRLNAIGQINRLPDGVQKVLLDTMEATRHNSEMILNLALSYGGRAEIVKAVSGLVERVGKGEIRPEEISESALAEHLYTAGQPDPDLLIRTSGEMRISNFMLWQIAYAEIFITDTLWPDFNRDELIDILRQYQSRERRYGKVAVDPNGASTVI